MAQDGDTITYIHDGDTDANGRLLAEQEDVSAVDECTVDYCDGAGANDGGSNPIGGGRVENATIDLTNIDTLYIWVAEKGDVDSLGRYESGSSDRALPPLGGSASGAGSTEVSRFNTNTTDSNDEPFLVGAGGATPSPSGSDSIYYGARGGLAEGVAPPQGGNDTNLEGDGAIDDQNRGLVTGGTTIEGGGSTGATNGEVQITYRLTLSPPDPPSNLSAEVQ